MDTKELNEWINTDEGAAWLNEQKAGLLKKRDELLADQAALRDQLATATQRSTDADNILQQERESFKKTLVEREMDHFLKLWGHGDEARKDTAKTVLRTRLADVEVDANGEQRTPKVSTANAKDLWLPEGETEHPEQLDLSEFMYRWAKGPEGAQFTKFGPSGGGAIGGVGYSTPPRTEADGYRDRVLSKMGLTNGTD